MEETLEVKPSKKELLILANQKIEKLEKDLKTEISNKEMYQRNAKAAQDEIDGLHDFLDGFEYALPRVKTNGYSENKVTIRLLSWVASELRK